ncbi:MAG: CHAP domain-containing protein [Ruminococcus sp.]|nr:CHAP domain-containing protein [Ruminococcus sp.]
MNFKRILAAVLLLILAVTPITAMAAFSEDTAQVAESSYKPRLKAPSHSNDYYYSNMNIFYSIGYGMPNCTAYAWGRAYELLGTQPKLSLDSAHYWYDYNKDHNYYPCGKTPKLGAIACWDNPYGGHVAVVEKITDTTVTLSHSEWGGRSFFLTEHEVGASNGGAVSSGWKFEGYIYILEGEILPDGDIYRVDSSNGLNMRKGAGTSYSTLVAVPDKTELVVTKTKEADGYTWGKTTYAGQTGWCVLDFCELVYKLPVETQPPTTVPEPSATEDEAEPTLPNDNTELPTDVTEPATEAVTETLATVGSEAEPAPEMWGDVNGDGRTNVGDATMLQKYIASMNVNIILERTDINGDGKVSVSDATYIQKTLAGL